MIIDVIGSGSKGNSCFIGEKDTRILIDCGLSFKRVKEEIGISPLDGIFITHEHSDHISQLKMIQKNYLGEVFITEKTYNNLPLKDKDVPHDFLHSKETVHLNNLDIMPIPIFHDAKDPIGFIITSANEKIVYITDTGYVHSSLFPLLKNADAYILESNHDPEVLMNSARPFELKRRILGDRGHLCNSDSACLLTSLIGDKTKVILHAHISQECNLEELIISTMKDTFLENGLNYDNYITKCLKQDEPYRVEVKNED